MFSTDPHKVNEATKPFFLDSSNELPFIEPKNKTKFFNIDGPNKNLFILVGLVLFIISIIFLRHANKPIDVYSPPKVTVLITLLPIEKGQYISPHFLKQIEINLKELTPKQRLERLLAEQIENFSDFKLTAKKNIPPHKIIYWSDLNFISPHRSLTNAKPTRVIYGDKKEESIL
jgi:hypothetical protein